MAARKRESSRETLGQYHNNLRKEQSKLDRKLAGVVLWPASRGTARRITVKGKPALTNGKKTVLMG